MRSSRRRVAFVAFVIAFARPGIAQDASDRVYRDTPDVANAPVEMDTIEITGTHIRNIGLETQHSIQILLREDLLRTGLSNVADIVQSLIVANRTVPRAKSLGEHFAHLGPVSGCGYDDLAGQSFDIVINATSAGLSGTMPPLPDGIFAPGSLAYKMMYGLGDTPFRSFARDQGAGMISEGLGMLVEQAAESFFVWRGVRPDCAPVMDLLRGA